MNIIQLPRIVLFYGCAALIFFGLSFFVNESLGIAYNEVYVVIANAHIMIALAILFALFALIVWGVLRLKKKTKCTFELGTLLCHAFCCFLVWFYISN